MTGARWRAADAFTRETRDEPLPTLPGYRPTFGLVLRTFAVYSDNGTGVAYPSLVELMAATGLGRTAVLDGLAWAARVGWVDTVERGRRGRTAVRVLRRVRARSEYAP